jgi:hypothetical protein
MLITLCYSFQIVKMDYKVEVETKDVLLAGTDAKIYWNGILNATVNLNFYFESITQK